MIKTLKRLGGCISFLTFLLTSSFAQDHFLLSSNASTTSTLEASKKDKVALSLELKLPENGATLMPEFVVFEWELRSSGYGQSTEYAIEIVEILPGQTPEEAMSNNELFFKKSHLREPFFRYPTDAPAIEKERNYAWKITSIDAGIESEVWMFRGGGTNSCLQFDSIEVECVTNPNGPNAWFTVNMLVTNNTGYEGKLINLRPNTNPSFPMPPGFVLVSGGLPNIIYPAPQSEWISFTILTSNPPEDPYFLEYDFEYIVNQFTWTCDSIFAIDLPSCYCCGDVTKQSETLGLVEQGAGNYLLTTKLTAGPDPITKISATMASFSHSASNDACVECTSNSRLWGNFIKTKNIPGLSGPNFTMGENSPVYSREITWGEMGGDSIDMSNGKTIKMIIKGPPVRRLGCCSDTVQFCIRYSFTDINCVTCDTLVCYQYIDDDNSMVSTSSNQERVMMDDSDFIIPASNNASFPSSKQCTVNSASKQAISPTFLNGSPLRDLSMNRGGSTDNHIHEIDYGSRDNIPQEIIDKILREAEELCVDGCDDDVVITDEDRMQFIEDKIDFYLRKTYFEQYPDIEHQGHRGGGIGCFNGDFEVGSLSGWQGATSCKLFSGPCLSCIDGSYLWTPGIVPGRHDIVNAIPDPFVSTIQQVHMGNHAVRLGNWNSGGHRDRISKTFVVDASTSDYSFWYALFMQNPTSHPLIDQPDFCVRVLDSNNNELPNLGFCIIADSTNPFFQSIIYGNTPLVYRDWTCGRIDLSSQIGNQVTVEFITTDCGWCGHFGYAYIDDVCSTCENNPEGNASVDALVDTCGTFPINICGNYTLPFLGSDTGTLTNLDLTIYQNGVQVFGSILSIAPLIDYANQTYCFTLTNSMAFPAVPPDGFDFVVEASFDLLGATITAESSTPGNGIIPGPNNDFFVYCGLDVTIDPFVDFIGGCCRIPLDICGSFTPPEQGGVVGTLQNIELQILNGGANVAVGTVPVTVNADNTYCFAVNDNHFPPIPPDCFDYVVNATFDIDGTIVSATSSSSGEGIDPGLDNDCCFELCDTTGCCRDMSIEVQNSIQVNNSNPSHLHNVLNLSAGPDEVSQVRISLVDFRYSIDSECDVCVDEIVHGGSFYLNPGMVAVGFSDILSFNPTMNNIYGDLTELVPTESIREIIWGDIDGETIDLTLGDVVIFDVIVPPRSSLSPCCSDNIKYCLKFELTNGNCVTCEKIECYEVTRN